MSNIEKCVLLTGGLEVSFSIYSSQYSVETESQAHMMVVFSSNSLDPDLGLQNVWPYLDLNSLILWWTLVVFVLHVFIG